MHVFKQSSGRLFVCGAAAVGIGLASQRLLKPARDEDKQGAKLFIRSGAHVIPHPEKVGRRYKLPPTCGGEDAYFINDDMGVVGVADGVGGWAKQGVDPGDFSRELMHFVNEVALSGEKDPMVLLERGHARTRAPGSSTALVVTIGSSSSSSKPKGGEDASGLMLRAANLGDSGFIVFRDQKVLLQSPPQQHSFNFPFQIGAPRSGVGGSQPRDAQTFELMDLQAGDVVVLGTDGLLDNVWPEEIASVLASILPPVPRGALRSVTAGAADASEEIVREAAVWAARAAEAIAKEAELCSQDLRRATPFSVEAAKARKRYSGGKVDDITVIVSVVVAGVRGERAGNLRARL